LSHQSRTPEHPQMLGKRRQRNREYGRQLTYRSFSLGEHSDHSPPNGM